MRYLGGVCVYVCVLGLAVNEQVHWLGGQHWCNAQFSHYDNIRGTLKMHRVQSSWHVSLFKMLILMLYLFWLFTLLTL